MQPGPVGSPDSIAEHLLCELSDAVEQGRSWQEIVVMVAQALAADLVAAHDCIRGGLLEHQPTTDFCALDLLEHHDDGGCSSSVWIRRHGRLSPLPDPLASTTALPSTRSRDGGLSEILSPWGPLDAVEMPLLDDGECTSTLLIARWARTNRWQAPERAVLTRLQPHLVRTFRLLRRVARAEAQAALGNGALDLVRHGIVIVDANRELLAANLAARELLDAGDGIRLRGARLGATSPAAGSALARTISAALSGDGAACALSLPRWGGRPPLECSFTREMRSEVRFGPPSRVVGFICDPLRSARVSSAALRSLYGLTPTEARVAATLLSGSTVPEAAACHRVAEETARSHVKAILRKVDAKGRLDLVLRILKGVAPVVPEDSRD